MRFLRLPGLLLFLVAACGGGNGAQEAPADPDSPAPPNPPVSCAGLPTFEDGLAPTREIHVAEDGDDAAGDGSKDTPYATLAQALAETTPGTAVRLHPGDYAGRLRITDVAGTAASPVWVGGLPGGAKPRITGRSVGLHLTRVRYLVLHDLEVSGSEINGINCDDGGAYADPEATRHVIFRGLHVHDVGTGGNHDGLKLSGVDDYVVRDCVFERVRAGSGIDHVGCHHGRIRGCRFTAMGSNAIQCKGGTYDLEIRGCTFEDAGQRGINIGGSTGFAYFRPPLSTTEPNAEARDVRVVANVFGNAVTPFAFSGAVDCLVAHNTIVGDDLKWLFRILQATTGADGYTFLETQRCRVLNNVFRFDRGRLSTYVNIGPNTQGATYEIAGNLWYAADAPARSEPTNLPVAETGGIYGREPFVDGAQAPRITAASPCRGAGGPVDGVHGDFDGRCYADPPSIGAFAAP